MLGRQPKQPIRRPATRAIGRSRRWLLQYHNQVRPLFLQLYCSVHCHVSRVLTANAGFFNFDNIENQLEQQPVQQDCLLRRRQQAPKLRHQANAIRRKAARRAACVSTAVRSAGAAGNKAAVGTVGTITHG